MTDSGVLEFGPFRLLSRQGPLLREAVEIKLFPKALAVLWTLARQPGEVVVKSALMDAVWPGVVVGDEALTFQIQALRRALEDDPRKPHYIATVHRVGFRFVATGDGRSAGPATMSERDAASQSLVGRSTELTTLHAAIDKALQGRRQLMFISGEAGIGKTALVDAFLLQLGSRQLQPLIGRGQCIEQQGPTEVYLPLLDALGHLLRRAADERPLDLLQRVAPSWLAQLPGLISGEEQAALKRQAAGTGHQRMMRELAEALEQMTVSQPVVLFLEDLHWSDRPTLDLLTMLARRTAPAQLLILATVRPVEAIVSKHPVREVQLQLKSTRHASELTLGPLDADAVAQYVRQRLGDRPDSLPLIDALHARSGGHPLFMAQILDYMLAHGGQIAAIESALPEGLRDLIALQFSQLDADDQRLLEAASLLGLDFAACSVAACTGETVQAVEQRCDRLAQRGQFVQDHGLAIWPDGSSSGRYRFGHALYAQVLAQRMPSARRARWHRQIADQLESAYGERTHEIAGELAHHYEQAGVADKAVRYCIVLAGIALERAAGDEVRAQTERGLRWLASMPTGIARDEAELALNTMAVCCIQARLGHHHLESRPQLANIERLIRRVKQPALLQSALGALWRAAHFQARYEPALTHAATIRSLGQTLAEPLLQSQGHASAAHTLHVMGRHLEADQEALLAIAQSDAVLRQRPELQALEPGCSAQTALALTRWYLGFPDQALRCAHAARVGVALIRNPYTECLILSAGLGYVLLFRRDWAALEALSIETIALCERYGHDDGLLLATQFQLIARSMRADGARALPALLTFMERERDTGTISRNLVAGHVHAAEAAMQWGDLPLAQRLNDHAMALIDAQGTRPWEPEVWRMRAELLIAQQPECVPEAQACLQRALDMSRERQARSLELRAAMSLARLWQSIGRVSEALSLLRPIHQSFTEGFATLDLQQSKRLLDTLQTSLDAGPAAKPR